MYLLRRGVFAAAGKGVILKSSNHGIRTAQRRTLVIEQEAPVTQTVHLARCGRLEHRVPTALGAMWRVVLSVVLVGVSVGT